MDWKKKDNDAGVSGWTKDVDDDAGGGWGAALWKKDYNAGGGWGASSWKKKDDGAGGSGWTKEADDSAGGVSG